MRIPGSGPRRSLKQVLNFSKPKTPGFGLSRDFFLSVLCCSSGLPILSDVVNPKGENGAVTGQLAPLAQGTKRLLQEPLMHGAYALASLDKATVLRVQIVSVHGSGFNPEEFARHPMAARFGEEVLQRVASTWHLAQVLIESHDPAVYPALDLMLGFCQRLAALTQGVISDHLSQSYKLPEDVFVKSRLDPKGDIREHVAVHWSDQRSQTLGLHKFAWPELLMADVPQELSETAARVLISLSQSMFMGTKLEPGDSVSGLLVTEGAEPATRELLPQGKESIADVLLRLHNQN